MYNVSYSNIKSSLLNIPLGERSTNVISVCTGPNASITQLDLQSITINTDRAIAGVIESTTTVVLRESLYNGSNGRKLVGDPIADMYGDILLGAIIQLQLLLMDVVGIRNHTTPCSKM